MTPGNRRKGDNKVPRSRTWVQTHVRVRQTLLPKNFPVGLSEFYLTYSDVFISADIGTASKVEKWKTSSC